MQYILTSEVKVFIVYLNEKATNFDSFSVENIPQEVLNKIKDKSTTLNIFRKLYDDW